ncbi:MAG: 5-methyltetrahydropteroyltriglutamate--homocysteine S-methyltransferase [Pirellulales bacterium]
MVVAANLGFPRIGRNRELKKALEQYWSGAISAEALLSQCRHLRAEHWRLQQELGIERIPVNDFSLYDHVLDTSALVGAVPRRYAGTGAAELDTYFAMARGLAGAAGPNAAAEVPAIEMTKWFDTNYHYIVPEFEPGQRFSLASNKPIDELVEARQLGVAGRVVLLGPVSFLLLGKMPGGQAGPLSLLDGLLRVYEELLARLAAAGAAWVQLDEPCLALDLTEETRQAFSHAYHRLNHASWGLSLMLASYFGGLGDNLPLALSLGMRGLHLDLVRAPGQLAEALPLVPSSTTLSLGVVDGRNVWRTDLDRALALVEQAVDAVGSDRVEVAPSCSLLHVPIDLEQETHLDGELRGWLAFACQKLAELSLLARAANEGLTAVEQELSASRQALADRRSPRIHKPEVAARLSTVDPSMLERHSDYPQRTDAQRKRLGLPRLPTTTIGSFPQTPDVRKARADFKAGRASPSDYESFCRAQIARTVRAQEQIGLDVLVHGECERNDMVEYFAEQLDGYAITRNGWVQSYGSRCVKPPILFGDVARGQAMTVGWSSYAQSLSSRPVKGMLTGPVTMLKWSFVRDDQPLDLTCRQIALALRDEVLELEAAGIGIIQIDEPALREGLPLRRADWPTYLRWAVDAFRLAASAVRDETQIHTHMCYAQFADIFDAIVELDADVLSIETARSRMELLDTFRARGYPNEIGPGIYDIHSPRIPSRAEMEELLRRACSCIDAERLWVNPDCGLKTRRWQEVIPALEAMVAAAQAVRAGSS